jgi:hypothetical protein
MADAPKIARLHVVKYEDLLARPEQVLASVASFLDLPEPAIPQNDIQRHRSDRYFMHWQDLASGGWRERRTHARLCARYEARARGYGYSLEDLSWGEPISLPSQVV